MGQINVYYLHGCQKKIGRDKNYIFFIYKCKKRRNIYIYKKIKILGDIKEGAKV